MSRCLIRPSGGRPARQCIVRRMTHSGKSSSSIINDLKVLDDATPDSSSSVQGTVSPATTADMDTPLFYIAKYNRIVDGRHLNWSSCHKYTTFSQERTTFITDAVKRSQTFEKLIITLRDEFHSTSSLHKDSPKRLFRQSLGGGGGEEEDYAQSLWTSSRVSSPVLLLSYYLKLAKFRLTLLVAATSAGGFAMAPQSDYFEPKMFFISTLGVILLSASANSVNQVMEVPFDSQMKRTNNRVLVRGHLTPLHAVTFGLVCGFGGAFIMTHYVNPTAAILGLMNLILYTCVYTPFKRVSIYNTWVGSIVGAIPPLIGWASASGGTLDPGCMVLAGLMFAWQFPHFNALSWNLRPDYSLAGYRMMSVINPELCCRVALRYSVGCGIICSVLAPSLAVTTPLFAITSLPLNGYLTYLAYMFYRDADSGSSRRLFRFTLLHLPLLLTLMFLEKRRESLNPQLVAHLAED